MRIHRILNNNAVVIKEGEQEKIVMGSGIAFNKKPKDIVIKSKIEKIFVMEEGNEKFQQLLKIVPEEIIFLAEDIISYAEGELKVPLSNHIHISLTDHIAFAIERLKQGYLLKNKLLAEIKVLYRKEYEIGIWARQEMEKRLNIEIPEDEAGHIALHIHTAKLNSQSMEQTVKEATIINELVDFIEEWLGVDIDPESISHQRLVTHLRFAYSRILQDKPFQNMDPEMLELIKRKNERDYICAEELSNFMKKEYQLEIPSSEIGYIALHIQRMLT
ncbi:PRD domain-containing protein [Aquibacillus koreensis]|uniref:PRD domain-containing protein n=1 Tax=Aquibacillus koreensis TaxID=279446 RepID=A0A9X3WLQ7_9BACI|nr:PRD domain-containing protein [Aquibacillus koreensis]MCT2537830.1 PRD domain-containing protein [Aquibacillus koreensis]MDC3421138.1 PRD domain-containing protein [Aquibacillus koreensis]